MPRTAPSPSLVSTLRQQAAQALGRLHKEIAQRETELTSLKAEAQRWHAIVQQQPPGVPARMQKHAPDGTRVQWDDVLHALPETFTAREVAQKTAKPKGQVYNGIHRWVATKKVKKVAEGYQKLPVGRPPTPAKGEEKRKS
jgi:hypothetical protein